MTNSAPLLSTNKYVRFEWPPVSRVHRQGGDTRVLAANHGSTNDTSKPTGVSLLSTCAVLPIAHAVEQLATGQPGARPTDGQSFGAIASPGNGPSPDSAA